MKFTFKTTKPTGPYSSFFKPYHTIKLGGMEVGSIEPVPPFKIRLTVEKNDILEDGHPNCSWKWIKLMSTFESLEGAKQFLKENTDRIIKKFNLHYSE